MDALALGLSLGLGAGLAPGPLLVLVLRATLEHGLTAGLRIACAPLLSDAPIVALCVLVLSELPEQALAGLSVAGAIFVGRLAWESAHPPREGAAGSADLRRAVLVNALSPHPWVFWITVGGPIVVDAGAGGAVAFLVGFYATLLGAKATIAAIAHAGRRRLGGSPRTLRIGSAALLGLAALALLADALDRLLA